MFQKLREKMKKEESEGGSEKLLIHGTVLWPCGGLLISKPEK